VLEKYRNIQIEAERFPKLVEVLQVKCLELPNTFDRDYQIEPNTLAAIVEIQPQSACKLAKTKHIRRKC
jgi:hypothetical protein